MDIILFLLSFAIILIGCEFFTNGVEWAGKKYHLSEGAVGSVLAAVGTALPETVIPIIAILFMPGTDSSEIGVGAILGAPFMLTTLALFVCGLSVYIFRKRRGTTTLHVCKELVQRDLKFFIIAYCIAALAAFMPADWEILKYGLGATLIPLYVYYVWYTLKTGESCSDEKLDSMYFCRLTDRARLRKGQVIDSLADPVSREIDELVRVREPKTWELLLQIALSLLAIILGAHMFVGQIELLAEELGIAAVVLSLIIVPIATELPEKFNSVLWIREKKDTFAIGNITGAMVFQSCIPVTIGIMLTTWTLDLANPEQLLQAVSIFIAIFSAAVLYVESKKEEVKVYGLFLGGALYVLFIILVFMLLL